MYCSRLLLVTDYLFKLLEQDFLMRWKEISLQVHTPSKQSSVFCGGNFEVDKEHAYLAFFLVLFLGSTLCVPRTITATSNMNIVSESGTPKPTGHSTVADQAADGGLNVLKQNWDFETADSNGGPQDWNYHISGYARQNASYQDVVHGESYSGQISAEGGQSGSAYSYLDQYFSADVMFIDEQLVLDFYWNAISSPDISHGGRIYVQAQFYNGTSYNLYYLLSVGNAVLSNTTYRTSFIVNGSLAQWNHLQRNLLSDFNSRLGWSASGNLYLSSIYFYIDSPSGPQGPAELVFDDVSITNSTAYDYMASRNGNFEDGNGNHWSYAGQSDYGYASLSDTSLHGNKALNLTVAHAMEYSYSEADIYQYPGNPSIIPYAPDILLLDFDWNYIDIPNAGQQEAYITLTFNNNTYSSYVYFYLGYDSGSSLGSNYSQPNYSYYYFNALGFGTRGEWMHFHLDLFYLVNSLGFSNIGLNYLEVHVDSNGHSNAVTQLLVDSFRLLCYPTGYPGFELESDGTSGANPIPGWWVNQGSNSNFNHTHDARSGNWALNITPSSGTTASLYRDTYFQPDNNSFLDFWWRLDELTSTSSSYAYVQLEYQGSYYLRYYVALDSHYSPSNSSSTVSYILPSRNTTGAWVHTSRNITSDLLDGLGLSGLELIEFAFYVYNDPGGRISTLFDDATLKDITPPTGSPSVGTAVYHAPTLVNVDADDNRAGVRSVVVSYNTGAGWTDISAAYSSPHWEAYIPMLAMGTAVEYYVTITDYAGNVYVNNNGGVNFTFAVGDDTPNTLAGLSITPLAPQYGQGVTFSVIVKDAAGLSNVTLYYRANGGSWSAALMSNASEEVWSTTVNSPSISQWATAVEYYVVAYYETPVAHTKNLGTAGEPFNYAVGDLTPPTIGVLGPSPLEPIRDTVQFVVHAADEGSGLHSIQFLVDGELVSTLTSNVVSWNTADATNGNHTLNFNALDNAGNTATFTIVYEVQNPEGIGVILDSLTTFMASYGFFVGAGTVVVLFGIGKVLMNRRSASAAGAPKGKTRSKKK